MKKTKMRCLYVCIVCTCVCVCVSLTFSMAEYDKVVTGDEVTWWQVSAVRAQQGQVWI